MCLMVVTISKYVLQPKKSFTIQLLKYKMYQQSKNIVLYIAFGIENVIIFKRNVDSHINELLMRGLLFRTYHYLIVLHYFRTSDYFSQL